MKEEAETLRTIALQLNNNNDDIDKLYYVGMQNEEEFKFQKALVEAEEKLEKEGNNR